MISSKQDHLYKLEVPVIVELGRRTMNLREVMNLLPGAIIDLDKDSGSELELLINNQSVASGTAVKVGENFGVRISTVGTTAQRAAGISPSVGGSGSSIADNDADALAEAFLNGQDL